MGVQCCLYWTYFASRSIFLWAFCKQYSLPGHFAVQRILVGKLVGIQEDLGSFTINRWFTFLVPANWLPKKNTEASAIAMIPARRMIDLPCSLAECDEGSAAWGLDDPFFLHVFDDEKKGLWPNTRWGFFFLHQPGQVYQKFLWQLSIAILTDSCRLGYLKNTVHLREGIAKNEWTQTQGRQNPPKSPKLEGIFSAGKNHMGPSIWVDTSKRPTLHRVDIHWPSITTFKRDEDEQPLMESLVFHFTKRKRLV